MKGKSGRPWMDETEGRVIHTAGKNSLAETKRNYNSSLIVSGWAEWREIGGGAMIVGTEHGLQGASRVGLFLEGPSTRPPHSSSGEF